mgnify:CR=1 FL=1
MRAGPTGPLIKLKDPFPTLGAGDFDFSHHAITSVSSLKIFCCLHMADAYFFYTVVDDVIRRQTCCCLVC